MAQMHSLRAFVSVVLTMVALTTVSYGQSTKSAQTAQTPNVTAQSGGMQDSGPYVFGKDIYEFTISTNGSGMIYKFNGPNKTVVGVIMQGQVSGFGGKPLGDAVIAYNEWSKTQGGTTVAVVATPPSTPPQTEVATKTPVAAGFDAAKTVTLPDGTSVTFIDEDNATVRIPSASGPATLTEHTAHYHRGGVGGVLKGVALSRGGNVGGSIGGSGVAIDARLDAKGNVIAARFDTADGTNLRGREGQFQPIIHAILQAAKTDAGAPFRSYRIVESLKNNNAGIQ